MGIHEEKIEGVPQFASYFQPLLEILRDLGRSRQIFEEIRRRYGVPDEFLEQINQNGRPKFENRVACGRLAADLLAERLGRPVFSWGQSDLVHGPSADEPQTPPQDMSRPSADAPTVDPVPTQPQTYAVPYTNGYGTASPPLGGPQNSPPNSGGSVGVRYPPAPPPTTSSCTRNGVAVPC